jgi:hypothetical protein
MPARTTTERREKRTFPLHDGAFVIVRSNPVVMGELVEITAGSVTFRCLAEGKGVAAGPQQVDIMLSERDVYLRELPVTIVVDREEDPPPFASTTTRIITMAFGILTANQRRQLDGLLALGENC